MRSPASASENRTHGAKKIGPSRYSDFFNRIGQFRSIANVRGVSAIRLIATENLHNSRSGTDNALSAENDATQSSSKALLMILSLASCLERAVTFRTVPVAVCRTVHVAVENTGTMSGFPTSICNTM
jgi:hypothetical protein